jgi:hypothetical protein
VTESRPEQRGRLLSDVRPGPVDLPAADTTAVPEGDQLTVVDTFLTIIEGLYAHLPLKRARYGIDPVQRLRLLRDRVRGSRDTDGGGGDPPGGDAAAGAYPMTPDDFHAEMSSIVTELRDAHTRYSSSLGGRAGLVAVLPFLAEAHGPPRAAQYIASKVGPPDLIGDDGFEQGVELRSWSGVPFDRAVARWADSETGGGPDARRARALQSLTFRSLEYGPPPEEDWVIIGYRRAGQDEDREVRLPWRVVTPQVAETAVGRFGTSPDTALALAYDPAAEAVRRARQLMFNPDVWRATTAGVAPEDSLTPTQAAQALPPGSIASELSDVLHARRVPTADGEFGYLRIFSFSVNDDEAFLQEVARLLDELPQRGLIVDVRSNPGGLVWAAERILQLFTPHEIEPCRFSWLATDLSRALVANAPGGSGLGKWQSSLEQAVSTGEPYSQALPLTDSARCNDLGQRYSGPVLCVADANTYSSGDIFTAGFVDNGIGDLWTVGMATGAGGANVWGISDVRNALAGAGRDAPQVPRLPTGVTFTVAVRRITRVRDAAGLPVEDLGVPGHTRYLMTRRDLLEDNQDLVEACCARLAAQPCTELTWRVDRRWVVIESEGLDILDLTADGHPWTSVKPGPRPLRRRIPDGARHLEIIGWTGGNVVQRRRLTV